MCNEEFVKGSFSNTSRAAPEINFLFKAINKSFSLISPPLAALTKYDVFFIFLICLRLIIFFVFFIRGKCKDTKSEYFKTSSNEDFSASKDSIRSALRNGS